MRRVRLVSRVFQVPHRPNSRLHIRMSIHTGPVIGLVAGTKIPSYCIMSDTVDITHNLMVAGEGMKILITETSKDVLDRVGGYRCDYRGTMDLGVSQWVRIKQK